MPTAYVNIGSNQGDRRTMLRRAVALIAEAFPDSHLRMSHTVESAPWGFASPHPFLNVGLSFRSTLPPADILDRLLTIQQEISSAPHRRPDGSYCDRAIDIDLIAVDDTVISTPALTLPHPRMHIRRFVLVPMMQLAPQWRHPVLGLTPGQMLAALGD